MLDGWLRNNVFLDESQSSFSLLYSVYFLSHALVILLLVLASLALLSYAKIGLVGRDKVAVYFLSLCLFLFAIWFSIGLIFAEIPVVFVVSFWGGLCITGGLSAVLFWPKFRWLVNGNVNPMFEKVRESGPVAEGETRWLSMEAEALQRTLELEEAKSKLEKEIDSANRMRQRMQSIFESAPNGMLVVHKDGTIAQANALAGNIFRYEAKEMEGMSVDQLVPKEHQVQHVHDRQNYVKSPTKRMMGDRKDLYGVCKDGHQVPVEIGLNPIDGSENQEIVATIVDISERKTYQRSIEMRNIALENSNKELQEFAFIASHDLREPLRKIISFSRLLQGNDYGQFTEEGRAYSSYVVDAAERMRNLLDSLLSYSRVTSKAKSFEMTDLNKIMKDVCDDLQLMLDESKATIDVHELISLEVDANQIRQVLQNLIANAIKYRRADQTPVVTVSGESKGDAYLIKVADNGIGFENQYADQIFEVFKRLHARDEYPGTGMGLAICRKIVLRHHGQIWAESHVNQGSVFYIELPVKKTKDELFHV